MREAMRAWCVECKHDLATVSSSSFEFADASSSSNIDQKWPLIYRET